MVEGRDDVKNTTPSFSKRGEIKKKGGGAWVHVGPPLLGASEIETGGPFSLSFGNTKSEENHGST